MGQQLRELAEDLAAAVAALGDLQVSTDPAAAIDPPGVLIGPPRLQWEAYCGDPTTARFQLYLVVPPASGQTIEDLLDLVPRVVDAVADVENAVVLTASPGHHRPARLSPGRGSEPLT
jgi:hypothetical protein